MMAGPGDSPPTFVPTSTDPLDLKQGPLAIAGTDLIQVFREVQRVQLDGGDLSNFRPSNRFLQVKNGRVEVTVRVFGDVKAFAAAVNADPAIGFQPGAVSQQFHRIDGTVPIASLVKLAQFKRTSGGKVTLQTAGISPVYTPITSVGAVENQARDVLGVPAALAQFPGINGSGVTVGVLSDSVNRFQGGLADSIATGDLPGLSRINVLKDEPVGGAGNTDEGRAMLELIYDIAPGVNLSFYTAFVSDLDFADGIRALSRQAGAQVIVDDVSYAFEPYYQIGPIENAISDVVKQDNRVYFSSAGNQADKGFESPFRGTTATVAGVSGTFMDFDPGPAIVTQIPIVVNAGGGLIFQYDQPFLGVTSDVDVLILDGNGNLVNPAGSNVGGRDNNLATQQPLEALGLAPGNYTAAVVVNSGAAPGRIQFGEFGSDIDFSKQFANNGGITYPTARAHNAGLDAISVAAVPFFNAPPFGTQDPLQSEDFSSFGPRVLIYDAAGTRTGTQVLQRPQLTGPDGTNTSFFIPGLDIPQDPDDFPNFFGTSAAAPNLAALAALMRQVSPGVSKADVLDAMIQSARPLNGTPKGTWDPQAGFGLPNALAAFNVIDRLRVQAVSVPVGSVRTTSIDQIAFVFNKPVNPSTIQASDLVFTQTPPGVTVQVLNTFYSPAQNAVIFILRFNKPANVKANGTYAYRLADGAFTGTDGRSSVGFTGNFALNDTTAPRVTSTIVANRLVVVNFSEPLDPLTVNTQTVRLIRTGASGVFNNPSNVTLNNVPGFRLTYDPNLRRAVIDLNALPQSALPSDHYALVVRDLVRDLVGNRLDGEFNGFTTVFPSGNGTEGGDFIQDFGVVNLTAPRVLFVGLLPADDTGIPSDQNTRLVRPRFIGQITSAFPGSLGGLRVVAQFNALHGGVFDLTAGAGGRGISAGANIDVETTTNADGSFSFQTPANLRDGFHTVRVVVVGQSDRPPLPGLSTQFDQSFRIDTTRPFLTPLNVLQDARLSTLAGGITLVALDPVQPSSSTDPLAVPTQFRVPTLDPATATNISNYSLINLGADRGLGSADDRDFSNFITAATYVDTTNRPTPRDWYKGQVTLNFAEGLPAGRYLLVARYPQPGFPGITDAAGNYLDGRPDLPGIQNFSLSFEFQPTPTYITQVLGISQRPGGGAGDFVLSQPRSFYEVPQPGTTPRADAPPDTFIVDFSGPLFEGDYNNKAFLVRSADTPAGPSDGDFGVDPTYTNGVGYTRVPGTTATLTNSVLGAQFGQTGFRNRLVLKLPAGTTLTPDKYRLVLPNQVLSNGTDARIFDAFNNPANGGLPIDGEFLGNPKPNGVGFETLLPTGQFRNGLTGDLVPGGSFITGYVVVPNGNVIFAKPDVNDDQLLTSDDPDGSRARPYSTLAPEAVPNGINGGDLNSSANFATGFNPNLDLNGNGRFDRSAFYAASVLATRGPVVVVALPPDTNDPFNRTFVLQQPSQNPGLPATVADGSGTVPFNTLLAFQPGSILKMRNASLYVQNQGSAIQFAGGPNPNQRVLVTSYNDDSIGGDTNRDGAPQSQGGTGTNPFPGDFGGILLRNFNDTTNGSRPIPISPGPDDPTIPQVDNRQRLGVSGADDALSAFNFGNIRYGGGAVPQGGGQNNVFRFDAITLFNSRPSITNMAIDGFQNSTGAAGPNGGSQGGISGDFDSFREDNLARGPLVRRSTVVRTSLNGIYVRAEQNGTVEPSNAIFYPNNATSLGGAQNYTFDDPLPYLVVARVALGSRLQHNTGLTEAALADRLYVQPGMIVKFQRGSALLQAPNASLNVGDRTYIRQYDANPIFAPTDANFVQQKVGDARVIFTSIFDDNATTFFVDPTTGARTTIVAPLDSDNGTTLLPTPGNVPDLARWGSFGISSGGRAVIDEAEFRFGGASVNLASGTIGQRDVVAFLGDRSTQGTRAVVTNNNFFDNVEAPVSVTPNGLLAADSLRPLQSGNPFFRGNIMQRNDVNGLEVIPGLQGNVVGYTANLTVNSIWDDTDVIYVLRGTVRLGDNGIPIPPGEYTTELPPAIALTIQAGLPNTLLANGNRIANPGETGLIKLLNTRNPVIGDGINGQPGGNLLADSQGGAGFIVGIDDGVDGAPDLGVLVDAGLFSQIRILGIPGNETTGQPRVPVIITSLRDSSVGRVIRGERLFAATTPAYVAGFGFNGADPQPGDGGIIAFGANSLSDYNLYDPRDGSLIDSADIRFISRIEQQGGGFEYSFGEIPGFDARPDAIDFDEQGINNSPDVPPFPLFGLPVPPGDPWYQYNTAKALTVSRSNLASFSQAGIVAHPSGVSQIHFQKHPQQGQPALGRGSALGSPVLLHLFNNTISNTPVGIQITSETANNTADPAPYLGVFYNNTFYNNGEGIHTEAPLFNGQNSLSHIYFLAMDNIFANSTDAAVRIVGQNRGSQLLYNLYDSNVVDVDTSGADFFAGPFNAQAIFGNAGLRNPQKGDFALTPLSDAIDASLSEVTQSGWGNLLSPIAVQRTDAIAGFRDPFLTGRYAQVTGGIGQFAVPGDIVTLPGFPTNLRGYTDQFVPAIPGTPGALPGPSSITGGGGVFSYRPIDGERDNQGFLRQDAPSRANVGFGSRPFFDIGANEFRQLFPAHITDVTATVPTPVADPTNPANTSTTIDIYAEGGIAGTNQAPTSIQIKFDQRIDPSTLTAFTVLLQASGGDGIFGNANSSQDRFITLSGRLSYNPATSILTIGLGSAGLNLTSDLYRVTLRGDGDPVVRNEQGLPIDGESTGGGDPNNVQLPLPSGDGTPGGDFFVTFSVDTNAPNVVAGTFALAPQGPPDPRPNDRITSDNTPAFVGRVTDIPPPANPLAGQTVLLDIDLDGNGTFERLAVGRATTDLQGNFTVSPTTPLPDSPNLNVGPDGIIGTADDTGYSVARIRVVDQSGNVSSPTDPNSRVRFLIDTRGPRITGTDPIPGAQATTAGGVVQVSVAINENLEPSSLTSSTILVTRSGGDGVFGNGNDVPLIVNPSTITQQFLKTPSGSVILRFTINGATTNDLYRVTLVGSGNGVTDVAGNLIDGEFTGQFPTGDGNPGGDFRFDFIVFDPNNSNIIYVGPNTGSTTPVGSRNDPFRTIQAGIDAAGIGDTVAVLAGFSIGAPNVYTEPTINLKSLVKLVSADPASTNTSVVPGLALKAIIRPSAPTDGSRSITIRGTNLVSTPGFTTEVRGFTIASPLAGNGANTPLLTDSIGLLIENSDILIDRNYVITSGFGVAVAALGTTRSPRIVNNGLIGNVYGVLVNDISGSTTGFLNGETGVPIVNNTFAFNNYGTFVLTDANGPTIADIENNIYWQNAERSTARNGAAIIASNPNRTRVAYNVFTANGPSTTSTADDTINVGGGFNPTFLTARPDSNGNLTGALGFVSPIDPRPNGNGPANFYLGGNYDLTANATGAIDNALDAIAFATDFRFRARVDIPNRGFFGPADLGAFEFNGTGGIGSGTSTGGGSFSNGRSFGDPGTSATAPTPLPDGLDVPFRAPGDPAQGTGVLSVAAGPDSVVVAFAGQVDRGSVQADDLLITGDALDAASPARSVGLGWIDDQTVRFTLDGSFRANGSVQLDIPPGAIRNLDGTLVPEFSTTLPAPSTTPIVAPVTSAAVAFATTASPEPSKVFATPAQSEPEAPAIAPVATAALPAQSPTRRELLQARIAERRERVAAATQRSLFARLTRFGRRS